MTNFKRLGRKLSNFAVPNLTVGIIVLQVIAYFAISSLPGAEAALAFSIERVFAGEWWRVVSFIFMPPFGHPILMFFTWYFFYFLGTSLEAEWGDAKYNLFILLGWFITVLTALIVAFSPISNIYVTNGFLLTTVFLAFARINPDYQILFMFILPIKVKWLAWFTWMGFAFYFIVGDWGVRLSVLASVANYFCFFGKEDYLNIRYGVRRVKSKTSNIVQNSVAVNCCVICGATEISNPEKEFRYCSKCSGRKCYCMEHLQNHEHK